MINSHFSNKMVSRRFFWFIWVLYTLVYMTKNCFSAAMASIVFEGVMTKSQTGLIIAAFYLVYAPLQIFGGVFADKFDPEKLIGISLLGSACANLIIFLNQNYYVVLIVWTLNAVVQFALWPSVFKIISSQLFSGDRKNSVYYISFSSTAGLLVAYLVAAVVPNWTYNFMISAIVLFALAIALFFATKLIGFYAEADEPIVLAKEQSESQSNISPLKLFLVSGFFILVVASFIRMVVGNSITTLASTMLMETYDNVSPSIGNLLNMLIIATGLIGTILTKTLLYPRIIKSASTGVLIMLSVTLCCCILLNFIDHLSIISTILIMCLLSIAVASVTLFTSYCTLRFAKFGKSGVAAGVVNAFNSLGVVVNSYGVTILAEAFNWNVVLQVFTLLIATAILLCFIFVPCWKRFKKLYFTNKN